jgi:hypothetical protein
MKFSMDRLNDDGCTTFAAPDSVPEAPSPFLLTNEAARLMACVKSVNGLCDRLEKTAVRILGVDPQGNPADGPSAPAPTFSEPLLNYGNDSLFSACVRLAAVAERLEKL